MRPRRLALRSRLSGSFIPWATAAAVLDSSALGAAARLGRRDAVAGWLLPVGLNSDMHHGFTGAAQTFRPPAGFTGAAQTFRPPAGITSATVTLSGSGGAGGNYEGRVPGGAGGLAARVTGALTGQPLTVVVGGHGR